MTERQGPVVPDEQAPDSAAVTLVAAAGTVLIWDANLVHASGPNLSDEPRRLLVLGYAPTEEAAPCRF
jgi:ectoine hydroxylase-related dioxygenase (phytanoyl-CoA dioxygenase family)